MNNQNITFNFNLYEAPNEKMRRFLWLGVHDEGIQGWDNDLAGEDFKWAIIRAIVKDPYNLVVYYNFREIFSEKYPDLDIYDKPIIITLEQVTCIADEMIEYIKNSEVDGDSSEQIIVFDITDLKNINMLYPKR